MQVPKIVKICLNKGIGIAVTDKKLVDVGVDELTQITGPSLNISFTVL